MKNITYSYDQALYGIQMTLTNEQMYNFPIWNWLLYNLNKYVWISVGGNDYAAKWKDINEDNIYRLWLGQLVDALKDTFYDANNERVHKCLINCPDETVAKIMYEATPVIIKKAFVDYITSDTYKNIKKLDEEETDISSGDEVITG